VLSDRDTSTAREGKGHEHGYFPVLSHIVVFKRLDSYLSLRDGTMSYGVEDGESGS
jgi:hypothetical protein